jgi:hypothetical protein
MKNIFAKAFKNTFTTVATVLISTFAVIGVISAATTIGTDITTNGKISIISDTPEAAKFMVASSTSLANPSLYVSNTGNVGIGTTVPLAKLDIFTNIFFDALGALPTDKDVYAGFIRTDGTGSFPFNNAGSLIYRTRVSSTAGRSSHVFYTGNPTAERMRINENGNVGIGTSSPLARFHASSTTEQIRITNGLIDITNYASFTVGSSGQLAIKSNTATTTLFNNAVQVEGSATATADFVVGTETNIATSTLKIKADSVGGNGSSCLEMKDVEGTSYAIYLNGGAFKFTIGVCK